MSCPDSQPLHEITVTGVGSELTGVGRTADGRALFVPGALPGERVAARIEREAGRYRIARVERILSAHPLRAAPACPHAGACGGCAAQHMQYALSLELKRRKVSDALARIGDQKDAEVRETIASPQIWRYRNKAEYGCAFVDGQLSIGPVERGGRRVIDVEDCLLQHASSVRLLRAAKSVLGGEAGQLVSRVNAEGRLMGVIGTQGLLDDEQRVAGALFEAVPELVSLYHCALKPRPAHALDGPCRLIRGAQRLPERLSGLEFELSPHSFFQVNRAQAENLIRELLGALGLVGREIVVDAYCGIGTLTLPVARRAKRAIGIEIVAPAVEDARRAARRNGIDNAEFHCGDAAVELEALLRGGLRPDAVVVDPPRRGVDARLIGQLLQCRPERIAYVSCDAATLARDLRLFAESGQYKLDYVQPLDMFPWTEHVECVALMSRD